MDEQNAQTSASTSSLAEAFVTVAVTAAGQVVTTSTARTERGLEPIQGKAFFSYQELLRLAADHLSFLIWKRKHYTSFSLPVPLGPNLLNKIHFILLLKIDHFIVVCLVAWPLNVRLKLTLF